MKNTAKSDCPHFRPLATNPEVCAKWVRPLAGPVRYPYCLAGEVCPTLGLRRAPRPDTESDSEE